MVLHRMVKKLLVFILILSVLVISLYFVFKDETDDNTEICQLILKAKSQQLRRKYR